MAKKSWGFDTKNLDTKVRPQDDFFHYANGGWLKQNEIPENESRWGSFTILRRDTDKRLYTLLKELETRKGLAQGTPEQMIRDFYRSGMDMKRRNALGITPLAPLRKKISGANTYAKLQKVIAEFHRIGISGPWGLHFDQDAKRSDSYALHIHQSGLGMPDRDYYLKNGPEQVRVREAYSPHMQSMLRLAGYSKLEAERRSEIVMNIETALAKASMAKEDMRDPERTYNKYTLAQLKKLTPSFDWDMYFKTQGAAVAYVIVMQPEFLRESERLLKALSLEEWQVYLEWHLVNDLGGVLSAAFVRQGFAFYGTILSGTKKMKPQWRRILGVVNGNLGEPLGRLYVDKYFPKEAKIKINELVDDLTAVFEERLKNIDWMSSVTKKKALKKLHAIERKLGYPDQWKSYKGLVITADDYFGNILRASEYEHKRSMRKLSKPVDRAEWYDFPQTVNAFYCPTLNDICFPAGILQRPYFHPDLDDAVNYGCMGMVIGHEITHGFDDEGGKFDAKGNIKSWWTKEDRAKFEKKAQVLEKQYNKYSVAPGVPVNGKLTLGENIADLGGASIAFDAYMRKLERTGRKDIDGFTPEQRFFLGFSIFDQEKSRPEIEKLAALVDPHSPPLYRVNGVLSNMPEFYKAWNVKKGDKLYRSPAARARVW